MYSKSSPRLGSLVGDLTDDGDEFTEDDDFDDADSSEGELADDDAEPDDTDG
jgi:hypothetical protein